MSNDTTISPAPEVEQVMYETVRINWYRCKVDKALMSELMRKSDAKAFRHVLLHLGLYCCTAGTAFLAFNNIHANNWYYTLPIFLIALFAHGTCSNFFAGDVGHELTHKTPFKTQFWNDFFLTIYGFLGWFDPIGYRLSHSKHHQFTTHKDLDGEVVLPAKLDINGIIFFYNLLGINPKAIWHTLKMWTLAALGDSTKSSFFGLEWMAKLIPAENEKLRRNHRNWARFVLLGHLALATIFIATGNWILVLIINFGCLFSPWLCFLCNWPQHLGLVPDVADFRLCCRTFTCGPLIGFLYWNMQYHIEHHMFPSVPFYNLPRLRKAIEHDLPPATHGLWATWRSMWPIVLRQRQDPTYVFVQDLPVKNGPGANLVPSALAA